MSRAHSPERAEAHASERERLLASILDTVQAVVVAFDRDGQVCYLNHAAEEACRSLPDGGRGAPSELLRSAGNGGTPLSRMRSGELPSPFESSWQTAGGELRFMEWTYRRLFDRHGELESILCTGIDVTERRASQEALHAQVHFLQNLVDAIPNPLFYKTVDGLYRGCNRAFEEMLGVSRAEVIGKTVFELSPPELAKIYFAKDRELFDHPGVQVYEASVRYANGEVHEGIYYKATYRDLSGRLAGLVGIFLDISERKRAERELAATLDALETRVQERTRELQEEKDRAEVADRTKSEFLNIASHELRTPLTTLRLTFHQLERGLAQGRPVDALHLSRINRQLSRLGRMVSDLLDVSRLEKGTLSIVPRELELREVLAETVDEFRPLAGERPLSLSLPPEPVSLRADPDRLRQVFANLIDNALKYTPPGTAVEVALTTGHGRARVSVEDRGEPLPEEEKARLFRPFLRLQSPHHQEGLGLGLHIAREIVERHGGEIGVVSAPGRGNTFYVDLPRSGPGEDAAR